MIDREMTDKKENKNQHTRLIKNKEAQLKTMKNDDGINEKQSRQLMQHKKIKKGKKE